MLRMVLMIPFCHGSMFTVGKYKQKTAKWQTYLAVCFCKSVIFAVHFGGFFRMSETGRPSHVVSYAMILFPLDNNFLQFSLHLLQNDVNLLQNTVFMTHTRKRTIMAQTSMTVRMDTQQKAQFDRLCEEFGMSANTAINVFVRAVIRTNSIPFSIVSKKDDEVVGKAREAFRRIRNRAESSTEPEMSLDEINAEIAAVRQAKNCRR